MLRVGQPLGVRLTVERRCVKRERAAVRAVLFELSTTQICAAACEEGL